MTASRRAALLLHAGRRARCALEPWRWLLATAVLATAVLGSGCGGGEDVDVAAASSLTEVLDQIIESFVDERGAGASFKVQSGGSQVLATRIEEGADIDLFLSADAAQAERVAREWGEVTMVPFAGNRLVLVVERGSDVESLKDLAEPGVRIAIGAPSVPVGALTEEVLVLLPAALREGIRERVVTEDPNVRIVRSRLELGEVDAVFIYATDLAGLDDVRTIELPPGAPANAYIAVLPDEGAAESRGFLDFLLGEEAQSLLEDAGFLRADDLDIRGS